MRGPGRDCPRGHPRWLGRQDSDLRDAGVKDPCLTTWLRPIVTKKKDQAKRAALYHLILLFNLGWIERFELSASRATIWRANQLRYTHHILVR